MERFTSHTRVHSICPHVLRYRVHSPGSPAIRFAPDPAPVKPKVCLRQNDGRELTKPIQTLLRRSSQKPTQRPSPRPPSGPGANLRPTRPH